MWTTLFLLVTAFSISAAEQCPTTRMDGEGQAFSRIPTYDQNKGDPRGQDICFSIVDSELIDAWRFRHGDHLTTLSSPLSIAFNHKSSLGEVTPEDLQYYSGDDSSYLGPGNPMLALVTNNGKQVCDQRWLDNFTQLISSSKPPLPSSVHNFLSATMDQVQKVSDAQNSLSRVEISLNQFYGCRVSAALTSMKDITAAARASLAANGPIPGISIFLNKLCVGHAVTIRIPKPEYVHEGDIRNKLDGLIDKSIPAGINYCGEELEGQHCNTANHTSIVIGRQCCDSNCRYLLRDSVKVDNDVWLTDKQLDESLSGLYWLPQ